MDQVGLVCLVVLLSSEIHRSRAIGGQTRRVLTALTFAVGIALSMSNGIVVAGGTALDGRHALIGIGSYLLGPLGAVLAAGTALAMRWSLGGTGVPVGTVGILLTASVALWYRSRVGERVEEFRLADVLRLAVALTTCHVLGLSVGLSLSALKILPFADGVELILVVKSAAGVILSNFVGCLIFGVLFRRDWIRISTERQNEDAALRDPLTGLANRRDLQTHLERCFQDTLKSPSKPLSVLMVDIDHFKAINDAIGHQGGDRVLVGLAEIILQEVRGRDVAGRLGGDEFAILLPATGLGEASTVAHRIRAAVEQTVFGAKVSVSIGIASTEQHLSRAEDLVGAADRALYTSKAAGRGRVIEYNRAA